MEKTAINKHVFQNALKMVFVMKENVYAKMDEQETIANKKQSVLMNALIMVLA